MYIQQTVLATKSNHFKVPIQVSLIDCLVLSSRKQYEYETHTKKRFIDKEIYRKSYGSDIPSEIYSLPFPIPKPLKFT